MKYMLKLFPVLAFLSLLTGCAVWTGGLPPSYSEKEKYPIIASVHGVKEVTYSDDLHRIVVSYTPTNEIILNTNTTHGWLIHIQPAEKQLRGLEFYILPKAARWQTTIKPTLRFVSLDKTTCVTYFTVPKGAKYISNEWGMSPDDPLGEYQIVVFLDDKLAADFKFRVIEDSKPATISKDQNK